MTALRNPLFLNLLQKYIAHRKLISARPHLSIISPLTYWIVIGFVVFNGWIAYVLYIQQKLPLVVVSSTFDKYFWTSVFAFLSVGLLIGVISNEWKVTRWMMLAGVFAKVYWTYALILIGLGTGFYSVISSLVLWGFAAWVQIVTTIYFTPPKGDFRGDTR